MSGTGLRQGLDQIEREYTHNLINYLDTGVFENKSNRTSMQAYTIVVNLADQDNCAEELYKYYINTITTYVNTKVAAEIGSLSGEFMLSALVHRWENHKILVHWLHKIFYYLDRYFVKNKTKDHDSKVHPLFQAGLNIFRERVIDVYHQKIRNGVDAIWQAKFALFDLLNIAAKCMRVFEQFRNIEIIWLFFKLQLKYIIVEHCKLNG